MITPRTVMEDRSLKAHSAMLTANVIFGLNLLVAKSAMSVGAISPSALTLFRMGGAAMLFWIASLFTKREKVAPKDLLLLFVASLFSIELNQTAFLMGLSMTSPIDASIIATTVPILTMVIAALYLKEPITWMKSIGVVTGASGAVLLILGNSSIAHTQSNLVGNLFCLFSATSFAIYLAVFKKLILRYSSVTLMKWMFLYAALCSIPFCADDVAQIDYAGLSWEVWLKVAFVVGGATFFSYLMIPIGQKSLRPTVVSMYNYVQPLVASVMAVLLGFDAFGFTKGFAALLVFAGVYIVTRSKSRAQLEAEQTVSSQRGQ